MCCFFPRRKRVSSEEDISEMGEFPPYKDWLSDTRSVHRFERWKDVNETAGSAFRRKTGKCSILDYIQIIIHS